jgi:1-acyl-sn-glycerol-3-phosphate acyltransferase
LTVLNSRVIPKGGPAVLVGNHISFLDWLVVLGSIYRPVRFVMWHTYYHLPLFRFLFRDAGAIPIASGKSHPEVLQAAFDAIDQALAEGELVCIFPEGQLTFDGEVGEFRKGVEQILERRSVSVIPFALTGLWDSLFSRQPNRTLGSRLKGFFRPRISLILGSPLPPPPPNQIPGLAHKLRQDVLALRGDRR